MRTISIVVASTLLSLAAARGVTAEGADLIAATKRLEAATVDPSLPAVPLEDWLQESFGENATLSWELSDCDLKPDFSKPSETYPLCVTVRTNRTGGIGARLHFLVGTKGGNVLRLPVFQPQSFVWKSCAPCSSDTPETDCFRSTRELSALPTDVDELKRRTGCSSSGG